MSLQLKNISLQRDNETHIYATDLDLVSEQFNTLLGTTLAGKTTLMRLMAGLEKPSSGEVWFEGENITRVPVQKRNVAMVYQQFINYPNFTVYDNIASPMRLLGVDKKTMNDSIERVASLLKLDTMLQRMPNELSGGQQQRTALARALVKNARLVLLDEPLANLDYKLREELRDELPKLFKGSGATVVYATTEPTEALLLGGYTAALLEGRVLQYGITSDVYRRPLNQASAKVFSDPPINTTTVKKQAGQFILDSGASWAVEGEGEALEDGEYLLGIRPHHLTLGESSKASVKIAAEVILTEISGSESTIHAQIDGVETSLSPSTSSSSKKPSAQSPGKAAAAGTWISQSPGVHILEKGQRIDLFLNTRQCLLFDKQDRLVLS